MSTYEQLRGARLKFLDQDPANANSGQVWYNSTTGKDRVEGIGVAAWSSGGNLSQQRSLHGNTGTQTAALAVAGLNGPTYLSATEHYGGVAWGSGTAYPQSVYGQGSAGTLTAAVLWAGQLPGSPDSNATNEYDGSTWTAAGNFPISNSGGTGFGVQTAAVSNLQSSDSTLEYNGSTWTVLPSSSDQNTARLDGAGQCGVSTAGLMVCGRTGPGPVNTAATEEWDGSTWSTSNDFPSALVFTKAAGSQTAALGFGGDSPPGETARATTCFYDGTSWTATTDMSTARSRHGTGKNGTQAATIAFGGLGPPSTTLSATEEFDFGTVTFNPGAWAAGGALNTARRAMFTGPMGTQNAGLAANGTFGPPGRSNATEEYDGSTWTSGNNTTDTLSSRGSAGTQTAGLLFGGNPSPSVTADTEEYDGTNWTAGGALNASRGNGPIAAGTQTAALAAGGYNPATSPTYVTSVEFYNGSTWTTQPNTNQNNYAGQSGGNQTAAWYVGAGAVSPAPPNRLTYNWDGTSWTSSGSYLTTSVTNMFGGGTQTAGWMCGGDIDPGKSTATNHYDGSVWAIAPSISTGRLLGGSSGGQSSGLIFGGYTTANVSTTEEFTGATTSPRPAQSLTTST